MINFKLMGIVFYDTHPMATTLQFGDQFFQKSGFTGTAFRNDGNYRVIHTHAPLQFHIRREYSHL
jgi:hypothetical protein